MDIAKEVSIGLISLLACIARHPKTNFRCHVVLYFDDSCFFIQPLSDCDADTDCMGSLVCHQRVGDEPVPGCTSSMSFEPLPVIPLDDSVGNNKGSEAYGHCQGDCDSGE